MQTLNLIETRIIGCLVEKAATTPDQYPLSLNSLTSACNQKSNREPVLALEESEVQDAVDHLVTQNLVAEVRFGGRVPKYQHRFGTSEFAEVRYNERQLAILSILFLRGAQTAGELRTRSARLTSFKDIEHVESILESLADPEQSPVVMKLPREPGKREQRWMHLFSGEPDLETLAQPITSEILNEEERESNKTLSHRVESLETEVVGLRAELAELKSTLDDLLS